MNIARWVRDVEHAAHVMRGLLRGELLRDVRSSSDRAPDVRVLVALRDVMRGSRSALANFAESCRSSDSNIQARWSTAAVRANLAHLAHGVERTLGGGARTDANFAA